MKALVRTQNQTIFTERAKPTVKDAQDVLIQVHKAALCRTDIRVAQGEIGEVAPIVLGHEFAGIVTEVGLEVLSVKVGDRVTVMPVFPCNSCDTCSRNQQSACENTQMLGLDLDGAFAEYVVVPENSVYPISDGMSYEQAAYSEPVAASLAVAKAGIEKNQRGLIYGDNRIAELTRRILKELGFIEVEIASKAEASLLKRSSFDYVVETLADTESFAAILKLVRPQGKIVLKSRQFKPLEVCLKDLVQKEIVLNAVNYGSFPQALELIAGGSLDLESLIGQTYPLSEFEKAFAQSLSSESKKIYFDPRM